MPDPGATPAPAPPLPAEYGAIRPGVDEAPPPPLWRGRQGGGGARQGGAGARTAAVPATRPAADRVAGAERPVGGERPAGGAGGFNGGPEAAAGQRERKGWRRERVKVVRGTRQRRIVRRIDTWTVFKVSIVFYLCVLAVVVVAGIALWNIAASFGAIHSIERSVKTLFDYTTYTLHPAAVLEYTLAAGAGLSVLGTLVNVLAAMIYNLISDIVGGVQIIVISDGE